MAPDLVLGHAHQACCFAPLRLRISRKVLRSGNGALIVGRSYRSRGEPET
jgi:hypothetical protein